MCAVPFTLHYSPQQKIIILIDSAIRKLSDLYYVTYI